MADWDPDKDKREYYRHALTGDLAWLVKRGGREHMKMDRPDFDHTVAVYRDDAGNIKGWVPEKEPAPLLSQQAAIIAFEADRALGRYTGDRSKAKSWIDLREEDRRKWIEDGPTCPPGPRRDLYRAIVKALGPHTR